MQAENATVTGLCECGCGQQTESPKWNNARLGWRVGVPKRFANGHNGRKPLSGRYDVDAETGCWIWNGDTNAYGYGVQTNMLKDGGRERLMAHRWIWEQVRGPIPDGHHIDHLCRNPICVNPDHLEPVTQTENNRRSRQTKLNEDKVRRIRRTLIPAEMLAAEYGVTVSRINQVRNGRDWAGIY